MDSHKISVIVPIYKVEPYLRKCLDSIVNQTYRNLEIILVDDGSPDNCGTICDTYAAQDERVRVIHKPNGGVSSARNAGLAAATGEWIGWVDSDDWIEPDMYEYMMHLALEHQADMVQCGFFFEQNGEQEARFVSNGAVVFCGRALELSVECLKMLSNSNCTKLYRADILRGLAFDGTYPIGEDLLFQLYTLIRAERIFPAPQAKYHYVQRSSSACNAPPTPERLESYRRMLKAAIKTFAPYRSICEFLQEELLRNSLDMCSKIVRYNLDWAAGLEREIRREIRQNWGYILGNRRYSGKEKIKFAVIAALWPVYRVGLPVWKRFV